MASNFLSESAQERSGRAGKPSTEQEALDVARLVCELLREGKPDIYRKVALAVDRTVMQAVLRHTKGNQVKASEVLGISRTTLRAKLRSLRAAIEKHLKIESGLTN